MECEKCKIKLEEDSKFCPNCGEKVKALDIKKDIGEEAIEKLKKLLAIINAKKKEENEKIYPCPFCNKEISLQLLKSKLNAKDTEHPSNADKV